MNTKVMWGCAETNQGIRFHTSKDSGRRTNTVIAQDYAPQRSPNNAKEAGTCSSGFIAREKK